MTLKQRHSTAKPEIASEASHNGAALDTSEAIPSTSSTKNKPSSSLLVYLLDGIGGTVNFSFFQAPSWVDLSKPPGTTSQWDLNLGTPNFKALVTGQSLVYSPNLIWLFFAAAIYTWAPYDIIEQQQQQQLLVADQQQQSSLWTTKWEWYRHRALLNTGVMLLYYGFWHISLYGLGWSSRPFAQGRVYRWSKLCHNVWYCMLGCWQWTAWEMVMVHLYATGRIGHQLDRDILTSWKGCANFVACILVVPLFREMQFFFAHRFLHIRCFYKYIHQLHHRNTDIEPFSGLCMSPSEHLYYISSIAPSVYWHASPFQFLWNGVHLLLSPGASHSGWEDHWHSDQFHVAHHRYFECNYGTPGIPFDRWFGSFRETMAPQTKTYKGEADECKSQKSEASGIITARSDAKSTLLELPSWDQMLYMVATGMGLPLFVIYVTSSPQGSLPLWLQSPIVAALVVSIGPLILAASLSCITANPPIRSWDKFRYTMFYPFHKDFFFGKFGIILVAGTLVSILPTFHFFHSLFVQDPKDTAYNRIWGKG